jgi:hypothetical protein
MGSSSMIMCDCNSCKKRDCCHNRLIGCEEYEEGDTVEYVVHCGISFGKTKTVIDMLKKAGVNNENSKTRSRNKSS